MDNVKIFPMLYQTFTDDLGLFRELGLQVFNNAPHSEWIEVGTVNMSAGKIEIEVICMPAKFWRFRLFPSENSDGQRIILRTGSGTLGNYWPSVVKFLEGMLVVEEFAKEPTDG